MVSAAAGGLAPVGFKQFTATQLPLFWRSFALPLAGTCEKTLRVFCDGTACEEVPARAATVPVPLVSVCERERLRRLCRDCGGAAICQHGRRRNHCRDCGGASICEHGRRRQLCRECGGASICEHGRQRTLCRECGGSSVCEHGRRRNHCRDCGGASICEHGRLRAHCRDCGNFACEIQGCPRQDLPFSGAQSLLRHMRAKHGDNPRSVTKSKELEVHQALRDAQITFEYQHHRPFRGCGLESETAHAYADFALPTLWGYVLLEVDEEQHNAYDPSCDARRDFDMAASVALGSRHKLLRGGPPRRSATRS